MLWCIVGSSCFPERWLAWDIHWQLDERDFLHPHSSNYIKKVKLIFLFTWSPIMILYEDYRLLNW